MDFAERLITVIEKTGLNQKDFAQALGKKPSIVTDYLKGRSMPSADVLIKMNKNFGISIDELLLGLNLDSSTRVSKKLRSLTEDQLEMIETTVDAFIEKNREKSKHVSG